MENALDKVKELKTALFFEIENKDGKYCFTKEQLARFVLEQRQKGVEEFVNALTYDELNGCVEMSEGADGFGEVDTIGTIENILKHLQNKK